MNRRRFYVISTILVLVACAYPIYIGAVTMFDYLQGGAVEAGSYHKYVIPYAPMCVAIVVVTLLLPVFFKYFRKYSLVSAMGLGVLVFFVLEFVFEQLQVRTDQLTYQLQGWQLGLCMVTPEVQKSLGQPLFAQNNPAFKLHFYMIALIIILASTNILHGYTRMFREQRFQRIRLLSVHAASTVILIGLCILACLTAFYRTGSIWISPRSAVLMCSFFIILGVTVGTLIAYQMDQRIGKWATFVPAIAASGTTLAMYCGELVLMGGRLYRYGTGLLFEPLGAISLSVVDLVVVLFSGALVLGLVNCFGEKDTKIGS